MRRVKLQIKDWVYVGALVVVAAFIGWGSWSLGHMKAERDSLAIALAQQRTQAEASGQTPVAPPPEEIRKDPTIVKGDPGDPGTPGDRGERGPSGPPGPLGPRGSTGPSGPPGSDGSEGENGSSGDNGEPGPQGATGPEGPVGADGKDGQDGKDGKDGEDGQPPFAYEITWMSQQYLCTRNPDSPDDKPTYSCERQEP